MNNGIILIGAGGHAKVIAEVIELSGGTVQQMVDADRSITEVIGYPVTQEIPGGYPIIIAIGNNHLRKSVAEESKAELGTAIHPSANISKRSLIDKGSVVMAGVSINSGTTIGKHCIINTNASVDHDCLIGDFVHISPNAALAGNVMIGEGSHIGIGSSVIQGIHIGKWVTIGAGAVIIEDIPDHAVVVGVPGKIIKYNKP